MSATLGCSTVEPRTRGGLTNSKPSALSRPSVVRRVASFKGGAGSGTTEPVDAVGAALACEQPLVPEVVQVRERLAEREANLVLVQRATEQHGHQLVRGARRGAGFQGGFQAHAVVRVQLAHALSKP